MGINFEGIILLVNKYEYFVYLEKKSDRHFKKIIKKLRKQKIENYITL